MIVFLTVVCAIIVFYTPKLNRDNREIVRDVTMALEESKTTKAP